MIFSINIYYNDFIKNIKIDTSSKIGNIQETLLNYCSIMIYNIEKTEILLKDNSKYILGSTELPFHEKLEEKIENHENIDKIIIYDRERDANGNVLKNNIIIDNYNKWYQDEESQNFIRYSSENNSQIIRFPLISVVDNIFRLPMTNQVLNSFPLNNDLNIQENNFNNQENEGNNEENQENQNIEENNIINAIPSLLQHPINSNIDNLFSDNNSLNNFINIIESYLENYDENEIMNLPYLMPMQQLVPPQEDIIIALEEEEFNKEIEIINFNNLECLECSVCLENFNEEHKIIKIKCNHTFHDQCIKQWLCNESNKCPICRIEIGKGVPKNI